jgi:hypothetical protein
MIKNLKYPRVITLLVGCLSFAACTQERQPCLTPTKASLNVHTVHFVTGNTTATDTALPSAVFRAFTGSGVKGFVFNRSATFAISLSQLEDSTTWVMTTDTTNTVFDTLTFYYFRQQQFISNACGFAYFFGLDSVHTTHYNIDSVLITNSSVTNNVNTSNLQIYIHPGA